MKLRRLSTEDCRDKYTCPSVWADDDDPEHVVVVGELIDPGPGVPMAAGERAVRLRRQTVLDAKLG